MKRPALHLVTLIAALVSAACSEPQVNETAGDDAAASAMPTWDITVRDFGPFDPSTPYTQEAVAERLTGYRLVESQLETEGMPYPVTLAIPEGADAPVIVVAAIPDSDLIFAVAVREEGRIGNAAGRIGQTYAEARFEGMACWPGAEERSGDIVCLDPRNSAVGYWLRPEGYAGPDGELPPADVLADAVIYEIRWTPPAE